MIRVATIADIPQMQVVRNAVTENVLSDPSLVPDADYVLYMTQRGKGWVWEQGNQITGFAIADLQDNNIWALFVLPGFDKQGIGRQLHDAMLDWYFAQTTTTVWLSTTPGTRAAGFYKKAGWQEVGLYGKGEIKFEMRRNDWQRLSKK